MKRLFSPVPILIVACILAACTAGQRQDTIRATLVGLNSARDGFTAWDSGHQQALLDKSSTRAEFDTAVAAYRSGPQSAILQGMTLAYRGLAVAATQSDQPSLDAAVAQATALIEQIRALIGSK